MKYQEKRMKKIYIAILMSCILFTANVAAFGDISQNAETDHPVTSAKDFVLSYFTPANGTVTDVTDGVVSVKFEGQVNIKQGMRFYVYRMGKPFYHPVTKEQLGNTEEIIGKIEVKGSKGPDGLYICTILKGEIKTGDVARITTSKIKLAFFQERRSDWMLSEAFYSSLKDSGRFEILESYTPTYQPEELAHLAVNLNAEAVLLFSTPVKDEKKALNIKLYWAEDAKAFAGMEELAGSDTVKMLSPGEELVSASLVNKEPLGSYRLSGGQLFAIGDVDGDGNMELVVSDDNKISIYSFKEKLQEVWSMKGTPQERHVSIDVLDVNNNGKAEIFVTCMTGTGSINTGDGAESMRSDNIAVRSLVVEYDPLERYKKIKDNVPYFFRVSGKTLFMQKFDAGRILAGPVYEGEWKDGNYQPKRQVVLPPDINIYGFTFVDWQNNGRNQLMTFDDDGYLILYDDQGHEIWKSGSSYGKFRFSFEKNTYSAAKPVAKWYIRGRLIPVRTDRGEEIIVVSNIPLFTNIPGLGTKATEVHSLWWDNGEMDEKILLTELPGRISDYLIEGNKLFFIVKESLWSLIENAASGELSKGSALYYYDLKGK
jgi:hypothetical protein